MGTMSFDGLDGIGAAGEVVPRLVQKAKATDEKVVAFVKERPVVALVAALAAGYVIGRLVSRFG